MFHNSIKSYKPTLTKLLLVLTISLTSLQSGASLFIERPIEADINESLLIVKGKLIEKYSKYEEIEQIYTNKDHEIISTVPKSIFTTFVFQVDEVLKGEYSKSTIDIKMFGGCAEGTCDSYSFTYDYEVSDEAVLFLNYFENTKIYKVTQSANTAFRIGKNKSLIRKSEGDKNNGDKSTYVQLNKDGKIEYKEGLNMELLKRIIRGIEK